MTTPTNPTPDSAILAAIKEAGELALRLNPSETTKELVAAAMEAETIRLAGIKRLLDKAARIYPAGANEEETDRIMTAGIRQAKARIAEAGSPPPPAAPVRRPAPTFETLAALEPRLQVMAAEIRAVTVSLFRARVQCANKIWYGPVGGNGFKDWLTGLVGWHRHGRTGESAEVAKVLASTEAFDTCYDFLFALLPDCRRCGCL